MKHKNKNQFNKASKEELNKYSNLLKPIISSRVLSMGFNLNEVMFIRENHTNYLRITIGHIERGIALDDCEVVSKVLGKELDEKDLIPVSYILEVQSPGVETKNEASKQSSEEEHYFTLKDLGMVVKS